MMRLSASRNQRSKGGFSLKLVLQICLLLAICTWLLYQVKHSHDKRRAFEDKISKYATKVASKQPDLFDVGRKGLPLVKENDSINDTQAKDADNEEDGEQDQDMKQGGAKHEEGKGAGDDSIDELDQDRADEENEQEEEFFNEEEKDGPAEEDGLFDNKEGEDSAQEAREENYKRDDASSAVAHDSLIDIEEDSKASDLEIAVNGTVDDAIRNVSNVSFGESMTVTNANLSVNGSHSTEVRNQNQLRLPENNVSDNKPLAIQHDSKLNDSMSNTRIYQPESSGHVPVQDQNYNSDAREGHDSEHHLGLTPKKNENGTAIPADLLTIPVIQNEVKDTNDKAAE